MALTKFNICSQALIKLDSEPIQSFDSDEGRMAQVAGIIYAQIRNELLSSYPWNFALTNTSLTRENTTPSDPNFTYQFIAPSSIVKLMNVTSTSGVDVDYKYQNSRILTRTNPAMATYLRDPGESEYPAYFVMALVAVLKYEFADIASGEGNVIERAKQDAKERVAEARSIDAKDNRPLVLMSKQNSPWVKAHHRAQTPLYTGRW